MEWVSAYLEQVKEDGEFPEIEPTLTSDDISGSITNEKFITFLQDREPKDLFEMALGGVQLGLPQFTDLATLKIAASIKGKSVEEQRGFFQVTNDLTDEQSKMIEEENKFAEGFF